MFLTTAACRPARLARRAFSFLARSARLWAPREAANAITMMNNKNLFIVIPTSLSSPARRLSNAADGRRSQLYQMMR